MVFVIGAFQSELTDWDSSESESAPVVRGTASGAVGPPSSTAVSNKPPLASVTEKSEVRCVYLHVLLTLVATSGRRHWPVCWCCPDREPRSFDVEDATTLSWSSEAVSD